MRRVLVMSLSLASLLAACAPEGSSAYVSVNLPLNEECIADIGSEVFLAIGLFDIAAGGDFNSKRLSKACQQSYFMHLLVNSNLKSNANDATGRAEPNVLQVTDAEVRLIDVGQQVTIPFDGEVELPNPFRVKVNNTLPATTSRDPVQGVVVVEAIPVGYDTQLRKYINKQILAEVQIFGTTTGDVEIDFKPFSFPIRICEGCLTRCPVPDASRSDYYQEQCDDDGKQDGRVCVDTSLFDDNCTAPAAAVSN